MNAPNDIVYFRKALLSWFATHRRDFPWRKEEVSNYEVIFSEVLLQRTKAETVSRFYETFFGRFPNWDVLAEATVEELEAVLKPLGLSKHRSKRIYRIAREYKERQGILPKNRYQLQDSEMASLYLGNAYELFILKHRSALIDVNMARLLNRYFAPEGAGDLRVNKSLQVMAKTVINVKNCKELNWAILDLAAIVCRPQKPKCGICPLRRRCRYIWLA